jgi:putative NIF3 family GTP cyclohydrolase 1 type 2
MKATQLYQQLEEFITPGMIEDSFNYMDSVADFVCDNFRKRSMGLICDFAVEINKVYSAVFPSREVMQGIIDTGTQDAMLYTHHPSTWDSRKRPAFLQMERGLLQQFKKKRISIYNHHIPLDDYGEYSTSVTLAKALGIKPETPFASYFGCICGVFGKTDLVTVQDLRNRFQDAVGHEVSLYDYGDNIIKDGTVAVIAGGGLGGFTGGDAELLDEIVKAGVNTYVTGITAKWARSEEGHEFAKEHGINILGGTHYSTEKFACMSMVDYFKEMGLPSEFIEEIPVLEDM